MMCPLRTSIEDKIKTIVADRQAIPFHEIKRETTFEHLGVDSLESIELAMALEEEFKIDIPDKDLEKLVTIGDIVTYIEGRMKK